MRDQHAHEAKSATYHLGQSPMDSKFSRWWAKVEQDATTKADALSSLLAVVEQIGTLAPKAKAIYKGFELESGNGVVCSIPDEGIDAKPHRTWCARCQSRYKALAKLATELEALSSVASETREG